MVEIGNKYKTLSEAEQEHKYDPMPKNFWKK